jgi:hypothetical protein
MGFGIRQVRVNGHMVPYEMDYHRACVFDFRVTAVEVVDVSAVDAVVLNADAYVLDKM